MTIWKVCFVLSLVTLVSTAASSVGQQSSSEFEDAYTELSAQQILKIIAETRAENQLLGARSQDPNFVVVRNGDGWLVLSASAARSVMGAGTYVRAQSAAGSDSPAMRGVLGRKLEILGLSPAAFETLMQAATKTKSIDEIARMPSDRLRGHLDQAIRQYREDLLKTGGITDYLNDNAKFLRQAERTLAALLEEIEELPGAESEHELPVLTRAQASELRPSHYTPLSSPWKGAGTCSGHTTCLKDEMCYPACALGYWRNRDTCTCYLPE